MIARFIEVHDGLQPLSINVDRIEWFGDETIILSDNEIRVIESYEEIKALVKDSLQKKVATQDLIPLSMDDMESLVMQPVWNAAFDKWYLVAQYDKETRTVQVVNAQGFQYWIDEDTLKTLPHYQTKK